MCPSASHSPGGGQFGSQVSCPAPNTPQLASSCEGTVSKRVLVHPFLEQLEVGTGDRAAGVRNSGVFGHGMLVQLFVMTGSGA